MYHIAFTVFIIKFGNFYEIVLVRFAELKETANDRANIGVIIIVYRPMIGLIFSRQLLVFLYRADVLANIVSRQSLVLEY